MNKTTSVEEALLKDAGFFLTPRRVRMLEIFHDRARNREGLSKHLTAEDLYEALNAEGIKASLGTIYRALSAFAEKGLLREFNAGGSRTFYEWADCAHHDHLICTGCRQILEFVDEGLEESQRRIAEKYGFKLTDHVTVLYGKCADCCARK